MHPAWRGLALTVIAVLSALATWTATPPGSAWGAGAPEDEIRTGYSRDFQSVDPAHIPGSPDYQAAMNIYSGLVRYKKDSTEVEPDLAERWTVSADGKTYTFYLRRNVIWHAGYGRFTAHDVKYTLERIKDPATRSRYARPLEILDRIDVVNDYTVRLVLKQPYSALLGAVLAFRPGFIVKKEAVEKLGKDFPLNPTGTGPFQFVSYRPRQEMIWVANERYYFGAPQIKRVRWRIIPDEMATALALQRDEINYMIVRKPEVYRLLKGVPSVRMTATPSAGWETIFINTRRKPFDDVRVRRAVAHAINKDQLAFSVAQGMATVGTGSVIPPGVFGHTGDIPRYEHSVERARRLLQEAGYGRGLTATLIFRQEGASPDVATAMQAMLAEIGITLKLELLESGAYFARRNTGNYDMLINNISRAEPDQFLTEIFHSANIPPGNNEAFYGGADSLIDAQRVEVTPERRRQLIVEAQRKIAQDVPAIVLWNDFNVVAYQRYVRGQVANISHWMTRFEFMHFAR
ncbi:MAG: ABC transporter substrate-binding protein [Armatimonadetes bacterium]|nr:ABC transporter substrate-binding protein [Armatimonadota bacterium]